MTSILSFNFVLPIGLLLLQAFILLLISTSVLKKLKLLRTPYAGMEYSQIIVAATFLFGVFLISTADTSGLFQAFKTFQNAKQDLWSNTFMKFSQFFLVILFFQVIFVLASFLLCKLLLGYKNTFQEIDEGNVPASILTSVVLLCFSMVLQVAAKETIDYITPKYLNIL